MKCQNCKKEIIEWIIKDKQEAIEICINMIMGFDVTKEDLEDFI